MSVFSSEELSQKIDSLIKNSRFIEALPDMIKASEAAKLSLMKGKSDLRELSSVLGDPRYVFNELMVQFLRAIEDRDMERALWGARALIKEGHEGLFMDD